MHKRDINCLIFTLPTTPSLLHLKQLIGKTDIISQVYQNNSCVLYVRQSNFADCPDSLIIVDDVSLCLATTGYTFYREYQQQL